METFVADRLLHFCNVAVQKCQKMPPMEIGYYDFTFVLSGEMTYLANGEKLVLRDHDAILLPPGTHRERLEGQAPVRYVSFNFLPLEGCGAETLPVYIKGGITQEMRVAVMNFPTSHVIPDTASPQKCLHLLNYLLLCLSETAQCQTQNEHTLRMLQYVKTHITERMSLCRISAEVGLSREYASTLFRREMGETLTDYVNGEKMRLARGMILGGELTLSEIASSLGYENYNYFSRTFKACFGVSPVRFRAQLKKAGN